MGKKSGDRKKARKAKLPKEVMGIRLPKELREVGGAVLEKANSPQGREMLAAGLTMAAAAASAAVAKGRAKREAAAPPPPAEPAAATAGQATPKEGAKEAPKQGTQHDPDPAAMVAMVGTVAETVLGRLFGKKG